MDGGLHVLLVEEPRDDLELEPVGLQGLAGELVRSFLGGVFAGEGRYLARLEKVEELERLRDG